MKPIFNDRRSRTIIKSLTWFVVAFTAVVIILYLLTGDWQLAVNHAVILYIIKIVLYYLHERIWNVSDFGQELQRPPLDL